MKLEEIDFKWVAAILLVLYIVVIIKIMTNENKQGTEVQTTENQSINQS